MTYDAATVAEVVLICLGDEARAERILAACAKLKYSAKKTIDQAGVVEAKRRLTSAMGEDAGRRAGPQGLVRMRREEGLSLAEALPIQIAKDAAERRQSFKSADLYQ